MIAKIEIVKGDITTIPADAIVNAANSSLMGGGGVDGAIHYRGGPDILAACKVIRETSGRCETGQAVYTTAGKLPAKYVIHTVGPVWHGGHRNEPEQLASCYRNCLLIANRLGLESLAFPNISTGIYGYPKKEAAEIACLTTIDFLKRENKTLQKVVFMCFDEDNFSLYNSLLD